MNRLVLSKYEKNNQLFISYNLLDENRRLIDFQLFSESQKSLVNNIYVARVDKVIPGIKAAFVTIGKGQNCYLPIEDTKSIIYTNKRSNKDSLCSGDEILVQVVKDAIKTKDPVVSTKLSLYGNYSIITTDNTTIGISKKIPKLIGERIKGVISEAVVNHEEDNYGIVIRTNAKDVDESTIVNDLESTIELYRTILKRAEHAVLYSKLYETTKDYILKLYHLDLSTIDEILTDSDEIFEELSVLTNNSNISNKLKRYDDSAISLNMLYKLNTQINELFASQVWLNSGANIIIEQLETLSVVDVNSSKCATKKDEDIFNINIEAATETARQLRLRNISGMIIIDFINMKSKDDQNKLIEHLKSELKKDSITCNFIDITKLGLVEITRKKEYKSLKETIQQN